MALSIKVEAKVVGQTKRPFGIWEASLPIDTDEQQFQGSLQRFISQLVKVEVKAFIERKEKRRLDRIMAPAEISAGARQGKIDPAGRDLDQAVDVEQAVQTALQAFEDGLYFVFIDREQIQNLESEIIVNQGSQVTFLRLIALAGG
ncbi:MAG: hypothetical protein GQ562_07520 [Anaerolineales bacterium]|nr:hypothetical protein [Anaerolineales bacterium]